MSVVDLYLYGPELRKISEPVSAAEFGTPGLRELVQNLWDTCFVHQGVGLAAPQLHIFKRVAVVCVSRERNRNGGSTEVIHERFALINPEISDPSGEIEDWEGCLSCPGREFWAKVKRPRDLVCKYQDEEGEYHTIVAENALARAILHETEHAFGIMYFDHISALKRRMILDRFHRYERNIERGRGRRFNFAAGVLPG